MKEHVNKKVKIIYKSPFIKFHRNEPEFKTTEGIQVNHNSNHVYIMKHYSDSDVGTLEIYRYSDIVQMHEIKEFTDDRLCELK